MLSPEMLSCLDRNGLRIRKIREWETVAIPKLSRHNGTLFTSTFNDYRSSSTDPALILQSSMICYLQDFAPQIKSC